MRGAAFPRSLFRVSIMRSAAPVTGSAGALARSTEPHPVGLGNNRRPVAWASCVINFTYSSLAHWLDPRQTTMAKFLRIGVHHSNVSGYTSKAWSIRRVGTTVLLKWGVVEVRGVGRNRR